MRRYDAGSEIQPPTDGLVAHWSMDSHTLGDGTITDVSGNDNTGTITGSPSSVDGQAGEGFRFDGDDDQIVIPLSSSLSPDSISVFAWMKSSYNSWQVLVRTDTYSMQQRKPGTFRADVTTGGTSYNTGSGPNINDDEWHHVGFTYDGGTLTPYTDGVSHDIDSSMSGPIDTPSTDVYIPYNADPDEGKTLYSGIIDDVRIYDHALTESEIQSLYQYDSGWTHAPVHAYDGFRERHVGLPTFRWDESANQWMDAYLSEGLVVYWPFEAETIDTDTDTVTDLSGSGYSGSIYGASTITTGPVADGLGFVTTTGRAGGDSIFTVPESVTFSLWVRVETGGQTWKSVLTNNPGGSQGGYTGFRFVLDGTSDFRLDLSNATAGTSIRSNLFTPTIGQWHHLAGTYDGETMTFWADGTRLSSHAYSDAITDDHLSVGASTNGSNNADVAADEVRVYDRVLSDREIIALYQQGAIE